MNNFTGIPCKHATCCITYNRKEMESYVHEYYSRDLYLKVYGDMIHPIHDEQLWEHVDNEEVQPPHLKRLHGRLRKS